MRHFHTKVVGVTKRNDDGSSRQQILSTCSAGEALVLDSEPENPYDQNAIKVLRQNGQQLGYLKTELAEQVADEAASGFTFTVFVKELTGGGHGESLGCNLLVIVGSPGETSQAATEYIHSVWRPVANPVPRKRTGFLESIVNLFRW